MQIIRFIKVLNLGTYGKASKTKGYLGAFLTGMLGGAFSSPCTTPVLLSTIVLASTSESILYSFLIFLMYSLGYNILILIAGVSVGYINKIINSKNYIRVEKIFKILTGVFIFIIGFYMVYQGF